MSQQRPRQVTFLAGLLIAGSVWVILTGFQRVASLRSLDTRDSVEKFLAEPPGSGLGISVEQALEGLRIASMVAVACAAALAILGIWLLQGSRSARRAALVLALPLFLTGLVIGGLVSAVVAATVLMLWSAPVRPWFGDPAPVPADTPVPPQSVGESTPPRQPGATAGPVGDAPPASAWTSAARLSTRPNAVRWACLVTWVSTSITVVVVVASGLLLLGDGSALVDEMRAQNPELARQGITDSMIIGISVVMLAGLVLWAIAAAAIAWWVFQGQEWARITLIVSASVLAVLSLVMSFMAPLMMVLLLTGVMVVALLVRPESAAYCRRRPERVL